MPKLTINLYGRDYQVACAEGQEQRVAQLAGMIDQKMRAVAAHAGNTTESRLFMLTCMMFADELMEQRADLRAQKSSEEGQIIAAIDHLQGRIGKILGELERAA